MQNNHEKMIPFLKQVAVEYYGRGNIERTCFVFPNRRSMAFFRKYLAETVACAAKEGKDAVPIVIPEYFTINDFMSKLYRTAASDRTSLLIELYECYKNLNDKAESLDEFIYWGDVLLADFNDVDKYLADPRQLYTNVSDFRKLQDSYTYLTDRQRDAIEHFVTHFSDLGGRLTVDLGSENPNVKERFLKIWNILSPLYRDFGSRLAEKEMAYEGMIYRGAAELFSDGARAEAVLKSIFPDIDTFVFTGLNALNECEKTVLAKMRDLGFAGFCWDWSGDMIKDRNNRSSFFMSENVKNYPQSMDFDTGGLSVPEINIVSVPSAVGQVKQLPFIFGRIAENECGSDLSQVGKLSETKASDCAVVLPDEGLLMPVLNTIPLEISDINVTMGYPMTGSEFYTFISQVASVQMNVRNKGGRRYFYHKPVWALFANGIFSEAVNEEDRMVIAEIKLRSDPYIYEDELTVTPYLKKVFTPVIRDKSLASAEQIREFSAYLLDIVESTASAVKSYGNAGLELEFAKACHDCIRILDRKMLAIQPQTYIRLLQQLLAPISVPFKGEPLKGLQIMGPLETRALDFNNIVILSANEGVFPRRSVNSSFIPPELRKGFGLPTYEYQDAVWAYYFYRMLTRAKNVWLMYDSRTEGLKSGEESRYIKQLQYHFNLPLKRFSVNAALSESEPEKEIPKTAEDVDAIRRLCFSASSLQSYLACPAQFYFKYIKRLKAEETVEEKMDNGVLGSIYHAIMLALYLGDEAMAADIDYDDRSEVARLTYRQKEVTAAYIRKWLARGDILKEKVHSLIVRKLHVIEVSGRNLVIGDVIVRYVMKTLERDLELMKGYGVDRFEVIGLEQEYMIEFNGFRIKGYVDRLDSFLPGEVRIVDYKTGTVRPEDERITDENAEAVADAVFAKDNENRPKIALQLYIYDKFLHADKQKYGKIRNCIYSVSRLFSEPPETFDVSEEFHRSVDERLGRLFNEMTDLSLPFERTVVDKVCQYCDYRMICGK